MALLAGGSLLGVVGAVLAVPLAAAGRVVLLEAVVPAIQGTPPPDANTPPIEESPARGKKKKRQDEPAPPSPQDEALQHIARLGQPDQPIADPPERV